MNLVADENIDRAIVERLRQDGHAVDWIAELSPSVSDEEVLRRAADGGAVLVTEDKDFGRWYSVADYHTRGCYWFA